LTGTFDLPAIQFDAAKRRISIFLRPRTEDAALSFPSSWPFAIQGAAYFPFSHPGCLTRHVEAPTAGFDHSRGALLLKMGTYGMDSASACPPVSGGVATAQLPWVAGAGESSAFILRCAWVALCAAET